MDDKQDKPRGKKKLEINKETIQELTDQDLDRVAGGVAISRSSSDVGGAGGCVKPDLLLEHDRGR